MKKSWRKLLIAKLLGFSYGTECWFRAFTPDNRHTTYCMIIWSFDMLALPFFTKSGSIAVNWHHQSMEDSCGY